MNRLDANKIEAFSDKDLSVTIYANENVEIENSAVFELKEFCEVVNTVEKLKNVNYLKQDSEILKVSVSSDFHKQVQLFFEQSITEDLRLIMKEITQNES